jgi:hypothetical protein
MAKHEINLVATTGIFRGLAKQNMLFHQCISELMDNSIASKKEDEPFKIELIFTEQLKNGKYGVYICDKSKGMDIEKLKAALQLVNEPDPESDRLHEHGFGLKNSLATLTSGDGHWKIWSKHRETICSVEGPFGPTMTIDDEDQFPQEEFLPDGLSTIVYAETTLKNIQTVQGRGIPGSDIQKLRRWLVEHIGVLYRGYLNLDPKTGEVDGEIRVSLLKEEGRKDSLKVVPVNVPMTNNKIERMDIEISGSTYTIEYEYGNIDEYLKSNLVHGEKSQYYYQGNMATQGIDIRLGKRVIATGLLNSIWGINRHNAFNDFVGEIRIPNVPRGILTTVNNKTDFNLDDSGWEEIFKKINSEEKYRPQKNSREKSEKGIQESWINMLKATNPNEKITGESHAGAWGAGVKIDVQREKENGDLIIYEMKIGSAQPQHVYQLKMYWDGLEIGGQLPKEAVLVVEDYSDNVKDMIDKINTQLCTKNGDSYNLKIVTHKNLGL